jgi:hypothetical protein
MLRGCGIKSVNKDVCVNQAGFNAGRLKDRCGASNLRRPDFSAAIPGREYGSLFHRLTRRKTVSFTKPSGPVPVLIASCVI